MINVVPKYRVNKMFLSLKASYFFIRTLNFSLFTGDVFYSKYCANTLHYV